MVTYSDMIQFCIFIVALTLKRKPEKAVDFFTKIEYYI